MRPRPRESGISAEIQAQQFVSSAAKLAVDLQIDIIYPGHNSDPGRLPLKLSDGRTHIYVVGQNDNAIDLVAYFERVNRNIQRHRSSQNGSGISCDGFAVFFSNKVVIVG